MTNCICTDWVIQPKSGLRARYISSDRKKLCIPELQEMQPGEWMPLTVHRTAGVNLPFRLRLQYDRPVVAIVCVFRDCANEHHPYLLSAPGCFEGVGCYLIRPHNGRIVKFDGLELLAFNVLRAGLLLSRREAFLRALARILNELSIYGTEAIYQNYRFSCTSKVDPKVRIGVYFLPVDGGTRPNLTMSDAVTFRLNDRKRDLMQTLEDTSGEPIASMDETFAEVLYSDSLANFGHRVAAARNSLMRPPSLRPTAFRNLVTIGDTVYLAIPLNSQVVHSVSDSNEVQFGERVNDEDTDVPMVMPKLRRTDTGRLTNNAGVRDSHSSNSVSQFQEGQSSSYENDLLESSSDELNVDASDEPEMPRSADDEANDSLAPSDDLLISSDYSHVLENEESFDHDHPGLNSRSSDPFLSKPDSRNTSIKWLMSLSSDSDEDEDELKGLSACSNLVESVRTSPAEDLYCMC